MNKLLFAFAVLTLSSVAAQAAPPSPNKNTAHPSEAPQARPTPAVSDSPRSQDEGNALYLRLLAGAAFYGNNDPINNAVGLGLDFGLHNAEGWGGVFKARYNLERYSSELVWFTSYFAGLGPTYTVKTDSVALTFGATMGALATGVKSQTFNGVSYDLVQGTLTHFAVAPSANLDFLLSSHFTLGLSLEYFISTSSPSLKIFEPALTIGTRF